MNLLYIAHGNLYRMISSEIETRQFLTKDLFNNENIKEYKGYLISEIEDLLNENDYSAWCRIALLYSKLKYIKYKCNLENDKELELSIQNKFKDFIFSKYSTLSGYSAYNGPVLLNKGLDYIFMNSKTCIDCNG